MFKLISIELYKIFSKGRTYIGIGAIVIIVLSIVLGAYFEGEEILDFAIMNLKDTFIFEGKLINGYFIGYLVLNTLWIHIPILVALVAGDLLAGEANSGTFRVILTRPISRTKLLIAKFIAGWAYVLVLVLLMALLSLGLGLIVFGKGDLVVFRNNLSIFSSDDLIWRFACAFGYGILTMTTVAALAYFLSAFAENSIGPIIGSIAIIIGITIISTVGYTLLRPINKFLFTTYLPSWQLFFEFDLNIAKIIRAVAIQIAYIFVFLSITFFYFRKKDILT